MFGKFEGAQLRVVNPEIYRAFIDEVWCPLSVYFTYPEWLAYKGFEQVYKETKGEE